MQGLSLSSVCVCVCVCVGGGGGALRALKFLKIFLSGFLREKFKKHFHIKKKSFFLINHITVLPIKNNEKLRLLIYLFLKKKFFL